MTISSTSVHVHVHTCTSKFFVVAKNYPTSAH